MMQSMAPGVGIPRTGLPDNLWNCFPKRLILVLFVQQQQKNGGGKSQLYKLEIILKNKETMQGAGGFLCADQEVLTIMEMAFIGTEELPQIMRASAWVFSSCGDPG